MNTTNIPRGAIVYLKSSSATGSGHTKHYYIVISSRVDENVPMIQCMSITSLYEKEDNHEIPILMMNNTISFVCPYNIASFPVCEVENAGITSFLADTEYYTSEGFIRMLMDVYVNYHRFATISGVDEEVQAYCEFFREKYYDAEEYRNTEEKRKEIQSRRERITEANASTNEDGKGKLKSVFADSQRKEGRSRVEHVEPVETKEEEKEEEIQSEPNSDTSNEGCEESNGLVSEQPDDGPVGVTGDSEGAQQDDVQDESPQEPKEAEVNLIQKPLSEWSYDDITGYLNLIKKRGPKYLANLYNVKTDKIYKKTYRVKEKAKKLKILR